MCKLQLPRVRQQPEIKGQYGSYFDRSVVTSSNLELHLQEVLPEIEVNVYRMPSGKCMICACGE